MTQADAIPFEGLESLIATLNKLFNVLFSFRDEFAIKELNVEVGRQMTLNKKTVLETKVAVALEPQEGIEWREFEELIATLRKEGFEVHYPKEVEVKVSLPPIPLTG